MRPMPPPWPTEPRAFLRHTVEVEGGVGRLFCICIAPIIHPHPSPNLPNAPDGRECARGQFNGWPSILSPAHRWEVGEEGLFWFSTSFPFLLSS